MTTQQEWQCFVFSVGLLIGVLIGGLSTKSFWKDDCVAHHAAHYDSQTGKWQWNDEVGK